MPHIPMTVALLSAMHDRAFCDPGSPLPRLPIPHHEELTGTPGPGQAWPFCSDTALEALGFASCPFQLLGDETLSNAYGHDNVKIEALSAFALHILALSEIERRAFIDPKKTTDNWGAARELWKHVCDELKKNKWIVWNRLDTMLTDWNMGPRQRFVKDGEVSALQRRLVTRAHVPCSGSFAKSSSWAG
jgi:hypothetical protein